MAVNLEKFGWDGLTVPAELCKITSALPTAQHLKILRSPQLMEGADVYFPYRFFNNGTERYMPAYIKEAQINDGGYAAIFQARRALFKPQHTKDIKDTKDTNSVLLVKQGNFEDACIKQIHLNITPDEDAQTPKSRRITYTEEINAILYEAYIHALLQQTFTTLGMAYAVPHLHEIVARTKTGNDSHIHEDIDSIWLVMELVRGQTLEKYLRSVLVKKAFKTNDKILKDILVQIAHYLHILQEKLHFNHRDMKINNLFVRQNAPGWSRTTTVPNIGEWKSTIDVVLIDFGFACVSCGPGSPRPRASLLSAGSWFRSEHDCLKYGRDLGQLLYSLHVNFPFPSYFSPELCSFLTSACIARTATTFVDILQGVHSDGRPRTSGAPAFNDGIYIFLRDNNTDIENCKPDRFLRGLKSLNEHGVL